MIPKPVEELVKKIWKKYSKKLFIEKDSGTYLHFIGFSIHLLGKLTALIPSFSKRHKQVKIKLSPENRKALKAKFDLYRQLVKSHQDQYGFILTDHCDATLFSGLLSIAGIDVDLSKARDSKGFWLRRSVDNPCYPDHSNSSISRDMMLGIYWYLYLTKDKKLAEQTLAHSKKHKYVLGKGDPARLLMMPSGEATLAEIVYQSGGKNHWLTRNQMQSWPRNLEGYGVHLLMMHGLLRGELKGYVDSKMLKAFEHYAKDNPHNPLYQAIYAMYSDGDMNKAVEQLLDSPWPSDRLPKRKDVKSSWVTQREYGDDWLPTNIDPEKEHSGGDFLVAAAIILKSLD